MNSYETIIGLEVHVELSTASKVFCGCSTRFGEKPNTNCCPVCMGIPGALPVLNKKVVEYAVSTGLALNCTITKECMFDRKNYFYPDLPKAYQISQRYSPIARNGSIVINTNKGEKAIGINEIHIEEDAGKLIHDADNNITLVDYNRSGVPLIEIVSEPDMRSSEEVLAYLDKLRMIIRYLGVSDCKMQEGSMRVDINLSVRKAGAKVLGTRTEIKNLNSLRAIARAIEGESKRQIDILESGGSIIQETRRWDDSANESQRLRSKEEAQDYRYFPEPDLAPLAVSDEMIDRLRLLLPEFREERIERYQKEYGLSYYDATVLTSSKKIADIFEEATRLCNMPKEVSNWLMVEGMRILKEKEIDPWDMCLTPNRLSDLILMIEQGKINRTQAKEVFEKALLEDIDPKAYIEKHGLGMISDLDTIIMTARRVIDENPQSVSDFKRGKTKAFGYLVGQTMKAMQGRADPKAVNEVLQNLLK